MGKEKEKRVTDKNQLPSPFKGGEILPWVLLGR